MYSVLQRHQPGIDKSANGHDDTCTFLLLWLLTEVVEVSTKNGSMKPGGADHVVHTRAFRATILVAVDDDGLGRDLFSSLPQTLCCDSAFHFLILLYGFLMTCTNALANDCGWF
jgi:hypothetical protein